MFTTTYSSLPLIASCPRSLWMTLGHHIMSQRRFSETAGTCILDMMVHVHMLWKSANSLRLTAFHHDYYVIGCLQSTSSILLL